MSRVNGLSITDSVAEQQAGDGRGNLSLKALTEFTGWFLRVCLDQVTVMTGRFDLDTIIAQLKAMRIGATSGRRPSRCLNRP